MAGITSLKNHLLIDHTAVKNQCTFCFEVRFKFHVLKEMITYVVFILLKIFSKRKFVTRHLKTSHREIYYRFSVTRPISDFSSVELFEIFASNLTHSSQRNEKTGSITETFMKLSCSEIHRFPKREKNEPIATPNLESSQLFSDSSTSRTSITYSPKRKERNYGPSSYPELDSESAIELSSPKSSEMLKISNRIEISSSETSSCSAFSAYSLSSSSSSSPTSSPSSSSSFNVKRRISSRSPPSKFGRKFLNPRKRKVTVTSSGSNWSHSSSSSSDLSNSPDKSRGVENPGLDLVIYSPLSCSYATLDTSCLLRSPLRLIHFKFISFAIFLKSSNFMFMFHLYFWNCFNSFNQLFIYNLFQFWIWKVELVRISLSRAILLSLDTD